MNFNSRNNMNHEISTRKMIKIKKMNENNNINK